MVSLPKAYKVTFGQMVSLTKKPFNVSFLKFIPRSLINVWSQLLVSSSQAANTDNSSIAIIPEMYFMPANYEFPLQVPLSADEINHLRKRSLSFT
jgi:hypothetical protein